MKRLCIYVIYDRQKIIDRYIGYTLKELRTCVDCLTVVCNMPEIAKNQEIIEQYADNLFFRENIGYDAGAFYDAISKYLGWNKVIQYDELILMNDSFFGPFKPMADIFAQMQQREVDFWGLIKHKETYFKISGVYHPEHIQSFFIAIRHNMLNSVAFRNFWDAGSWDGGQSQTIERYELAFTDYFKSKGYNYTTLSDMDGMGSDEDPEKNYNPYNYMAYDLIANRNFPFLKRSPFSFNYLDYKTQEDFRHILDYIKENTDYDVDMIWENIIRTVNSSDIYRNLNLRYYIDDKKGVKCQSENLENVTVVVFLPSNDTAQIALKYLKKINDFCKIIIMVENETEMRAFREDFDCRIYDKTQFFELTRELSQNEYVCIIDYCDEIAVEKYDYAEYSLLYGIYENLIKNPEYIHQVINCFESDKRLGFISAPAPFFSVHFESFSLGWNNTYRKIENIIKDNNLACSIAEDKPPFIVSKSFWIRGDILGNVPAINLSDMDCFPYLWIYVAQSCGYYSGIVENIDFAAMNEINMEWCVKTTNEWAMKYEIELPQYSYYHDIFKRMALTYYRVRHDKLYIYGIGRMLKACKHFLSSIFKTTDIDGYIVSDNQKKMDILDGIKVSFLSEIELNNKIGIIICLNRENALDVARILRSKGYEDYFII